MATKNSDNRGAATLENLIDQELRIVDASTSVFVDDVSAVAVGPSPKNGFSSLIKDGALHYTACGLDNVWLLDGYRIEPTPYGDGLSIEDADGLHKCIGAAIIRQKSIAPQEIRFLRKLIGLSQKNLGDLLGQSDQTVARWEKGHSQVDASAERLLRFIVADWMGQKQSIRAALEQLADQDEMDHGHQHLRRQGDHWKSAA